MTISRREFVQGSGVALASVGIGWTRLRPPEPGPAVVVVFLRGGLDGLSMIVPHGDPWYYRARPRLAVPRGDVIDLDGQFGLHPALAPLKALWDSEALAVLPAVRAHASNAGHIEAQTTVDGWLGRIRRRAAVPLPTVSLTGWDTHVGQGSTSGRLAARMAELARNLTGLAERSRDLVVVTVSEFGRSVAENPFGGTDHGHATAVLVIGGRVSGGRIVGRWPGLRPEDRADGGGVAATTDLRDVVSEVLVRQLGARLPGLRGVVSASNRFPEVMKL